MSLCSKLFSKIYTKPTISTSIQLFPSITSTSSIFSLQQITSTTSKFIQKSFLYTTKQTKKQIYFNVNSMKFSTVTTITTSTASTVTDKFEQKFLNNNHNLNKNSHTFYSKFTVRDPHHTIIPQGLAETLPLNEDRAYEILLSLNETEMKAVKVALERYEAKKIKEGFEGQLAATRWRSRFGRPAKMPALGDVDPTGSYCAVPDDWLKKKYAERTKPPEKKDLWRIFMVNAVPFIGFGFLDNFTMIIAGDYIESIFGAFMCISTMAAAGLGNTISDILGIGSAYYVERLSEMLGLRPPELTPIQLEMKSSRRSANSGRIFGITLGCVIGMFPLLFMDSSNKKQSDKEEKK